MLPKVTMPDAPPDTAEKTVKAQRFKCDGCGADLKWNAQLQKLKCDFCGATKDVPADATGPGAQVVEHDLFEGLAELPKGLGAQAAIKTAKCQECGASVAFPDGTTATK